MDIALNKDFEIIKKASSTVLCNELSRCVYEGYKKSSKRNYKVTDKMVSIFKFLYKVRIATKDQINRYLTLNGYTNISEEFLNILFDEKLFDAVEIVGGIGTNGRLNNLQLTTWQEQAFKGNVLPVVGSSDSHNHYSPNGKFGRCFSVVFAKENTTASILEAVRSGYSVAGEVPRGDDADIRFYGSQFRLVAFAHFLYEHYFSETRRLCFGEGTLMQRYAEGEPVGELLAAFASTVSDFYKKFYGLLPAPTLPAEHLAFLDRCRERQRTEGPATKGSKLYLYDNNTNVRRE